MFPGRNKKRAIVGLVVTALALAAVGGTALAGHLTSGVKSYTGCLVTSSGNITKVKEGNLPLGSPCSSGSVEVHFSGGDITAISGGTGLEGGGDNGAVTLSVKASYRLPQGCTNDQVAKWKDSAWVCAADSNSTYTAGTGLDLNGNEFSIAPDYRVTNDQACASGKFANGLDGSGNLTCGTPATGGVHAYSAHVGKTILAGETTVISKTLPAGTYLLFASVDLENQDFDGTDRFSVGQCSIPGFGTGPHVVVWPHELVSGLAAQVPGYDSLSLASAINHPGGAVELKCTEESPDIDVFNATLTAIKIDSLG